MLWPSVHNMPVFDAADACNRLYQITVSARHAINGARLKNILQALDAKRGDGPASDERRLQLVWLVPHDMAPDFADAGRRPIGGVSSEERKDLRQQFDEYVVGVDFDALAGPHSTAIKDSLNAGGADPVEAASKASHTPE